MIIFVADAWARKMRVTRHQIQVAVRKLSTSAVADQITGHKTSRTATALRRVYDRPFTGEAELAAEVLGDFAGSVTGAEFWVPSAAPVVTPARSVEAIEGK